MGFLAVVTTNSEGRRGKGDRRNPIQSTRGECTAGTCDEVKKPFTDGDEKSTSE